jgi:hypothetical protein
MPPGGADSLGVERQLGHSDKVLVVAVMLAVSVLQDKGI